MMVHMGIMESVSGQNIIGTGQNNHYDNVAKLYSQRYQHQL